MLLLLLVFLSANVSVLVLKKDKVEHKHFHVWRVVPVLAIIASIVLLAQQSWQVWLGGLAYIAVGSVLFLIARASRRRDDRKREGSVDAAPIGDTDEGRDTAS